MTAETNTRREFEQLAIPLRESLYGAAMRLARDPSDAADLVQDTYFRAYRFFYSFKPGTNIKSWMFTILRNTFISCYHRRNRAADFSARVERESQSVGQHAAIGYSHSQLQGPEDLAATQLTRKRIADALAQLPEEYRTAIELADLEGCSYKEIAILMDTPIGTVMSRIFRGRKLLHALLYDHASDLGLVDADDEPGDRWTKYARNPRSRSLEVV